MNNKELVKDMQQQVYDDMHEYFISLGQEGHYTEEQKKYAIELIHEYGAQPAYYQFPGEPCKGGVGFVMSILNAALPGFMNGQKGAGKGGSFGSAGVIIRKMSPLEKGN